MSGREAVKDESSEGGTQRDTSARPQELSPDELAVLNIIAEHEMSTTRDISGDRLHRDSGSRSDEQKDGVAVAQRLAPSYVECVRPKPHDGYRLTADGWLRSKHAAEVGDLVAGTLTLLHEKFARDPDFDAFTWGELQPLLAAGSPVTLEFARMLLPRLRLSQGARDETFHKPERVRDLAKLQTLDGLAQHHERERAAKQEAEAQEAAAWAEMWGLGGAVVPFSPPGVVVNNNYQTHIHDSVVGAVSQGEGSGAAARVDAGIGRQAQPATPDLSRPESASGQGVAKQPEAGAASYSGQIHGSIVAASVAGPDGQAHGIVNINHHHGRSDAEIERLVDRRIKQEFRKLRKKLGAARRDSIDEMLRVSFAVVQSLVAAKLGAEPDAASVAEFLREAVEDPAFPARAARLFQEGAKTPSTARREMLARALFGIPASTPERDRVDAALERLFTDDVALLRDLVLLSRISERHGMYLKSLYLDGIIRAFVRTDAADDSESGEGVLCPEWPLYALEAVGCVSIGSWSGNSTLGKERSYRAANLRVMPLGNAVIQALERTGIDLANTKGSIK